MALNKTVFAIIIAAVALKAILTFGVVRGWGLNWDESSAWAVAQNHIDGHGYTLFDESTQSYEASAFHGAFTVLLYEKLIGAGISPEAWALFMHAVSLLLFAVSVWYFYRLAAIYIRGEKLRIGATLTYAFYPSVQYYIGTMLLYENFTGSLLIVVCYYLVRPAGVKFRLTLYFLLPVLIALSCWFRPQLIIIYMILLTLLLAAAKNRKTILLIAALALAITVTGLLPVLQKNRDLFGTATLGPQGGFELLQGHNPHARGSWMNHWEIPGNALYRYAHENISGLDSLNEYEAAQARKVLAIRWALTHPGQEFLLSLRKLGAFFYPQNFEQLEAIPALDAITLTIHMLFLFGSVWLTWKRRWSRQLLFLYFPVMASLLLTLIFYFGCRWRFYAEPFMILVAWIFVNEKMKELKN